MRKPKRSLFHRMLAVLLSAVLTAGMLANAAPVRAQAQEGEANASLEVTLRVHGYDSERWKGIQTSHNDKIEEINVSFVPEEGQGYTDLKYTFELKVESWDNFFIEYSEYGDICSDTVSPGAQENWGTVDVWPVRFLDGGGVFDILYVGDGQSFFPKVSSIAPPQKEGFDFAGWVTQEGGGEEFDFTQFFSGETNVYASWTENSRPPQTQEHDGITFTAWTATDSLPTAEGSYFLTEDVTLSDTWQVCSDTRLCLNGKTIRLQGEKKAYVIEVDTDIIFSLYDCENSGKITGGTDGGIINYGSFCLYGGEISGNSGFQGGGMYNCADFCLYGGSISGNSAEHGGGIYNDGAVRLYGGEVSGNRTNSQESGAIDSLPDGTVTVGGSAVVSGNEDSDGGASNIWFVRSRQPIVIDPDNPLSGSAEIAVRSGWGPFQDDPVTLTGANDADYSRYFTSDNPKHAVTDGPDHAVQLTLAHSHSYDETKWIADETGHWHECSCGDRKDEAPHTQDEGTVTVQPTEESEGVRTYLCRDCGFVMREEPVERLEYFTVDVSGSQGGSVRVFAGDAGVSSTRQPKGTGITAKAFADEGYAFTCWKENGAIVSTDRFYTFILQGDRSLTAVFEKGHDHEYGAEWRSDETGHWRQCGCGARTDEGVHAEDGGTVTKQPTETEAGIRTYRCQVCQRKLRTETVPAADGGNAGKLEQDVQRDELAPKTQISTPVRELADMVLTPEERLLLEEGTDVRVVLDVKDASESVNGADRALVEAALKEVEAVKGCQVAQYLDISLFKIIGENRSSMSKTFAKLTVVIDIPDSLKDAADGRPQTYAVIRVHDGAAEVLRDLDDSAETITIETDRFSTYAIVSGEAADSAEDEEDGIAGEDEVNPPTKDDEPKTGDASPFKPYAALAMVAGFAYLLACLAGRERGMTERTKKELVSRLAAWARQGGRFRRLCALAAIFVLLVYYHGVHFLNCRLGEKACAE